MKISLPEQVWIDFEPASFGSRALAYLIDFVLRWLSVLSVVFVLALYFAKGLPSLIVENDASKWSGNAFMVIVTLLFFIVEWSYPVFFEVFRDGSSPGKRALGLQVVDERGLPISFRASLLRTVLNVVDMLPGIAFVGFFSMLITSKNQRLGDLVAKTMVIHRVDRVRRGEADEAARGRVVPLELYNVLARFFERSDDIQPAAKERMVEALIAAVQKQCPDIEVPTSFSGAPERTAWLSELYKTSRPGKRTRAQSKQDSVMNWQQLAREFERAERAFASLSKGPHTEQSLFDAAAEYQLICQRYGYLSTFYPESSEARHAAQLVRTGRALIYARRLGKLSEAKQPFGERVAQSFARVRFHVLAASVIGIVSGILAALIVQLNPNMLWHFLSEDIAAQLANGTLWTEGIRGASGVASSRILTNNIGVTFTAFALGVTGGVGTVIILVFNGAHLGGTFSALSFYNMAHPLFDFVVAHGFLEISVILCAGGCGLYLGDALLNPGHATRLAALQRHAAGVVDLVVFNALCLVLAGVVEGYVSPYSEVPFVFKLSLGLLLGALYWWFLLRRGEQTATASPRA